MLAPLELFRPNDAEFLIGSGSTPGLDLTLLLSELATRRFFFLFSFFSTWVAERINVLYAYDRWFMLKTSRRVRLVLWEAAGAAYCEKFAFFIFLIFDRIFTLSLINLVRWHLTFVCWIACRAPSLITYSARKIGYICLRGHLVHYGTATIWMLHFVPILHLFLLLGLIEDHYLVY